MGAFERTPEPRHDDPPAREQRHRRTLPHLSAIADTWRPLASDGDTGWLAVADRDLFLLANEWACRG